VFSWFYGFGFGAVMWWVKKCKKTNRVMSDFYTFFYLPLSSQEESSELRIGMTIFGKVFKLDDIHDIFRHTTNRTLYFLIFRTFYFYQLYS